MKITLFLMVLLVSSGCASLEDSTRSSMPNLASSDFDRSNVKANVTIGDPQIQMTGKHFVFNESRALDAISKDTNSAIKEMVRKSLISKGYKETSKPRDAHLAVYLYSDRTELVKELKKKIEEKFGLNAAQMSDDLNSSTIETSRITYVENGNVIYDSTTQGDGEVARYAIALHVNQFGKRPKNYKTITFTSPKNTWTGYEETLLEKIAEQFPNLIAKAPPSNLKMAGDPGCNPRFGYEHKSDIITKVHKGSAAEAAGFKLGDKVISIDSEPHSRAIENDDFYEKRVKVPVKIERQGKTVRTEIQARMMCDY